MPTTLRYVTTFGVLKIDILCNGFNFYHFLSFKIIRYGTILKDWLINGKNRIALNDTH